MQIIDVIRVSFLIFFFTNDVLSEKVHDPCTFIGDNIFVNSSGVLTSPGYGTGQYPPNKQCTWMFNGPPNKFIRLIFTDFDLQEDQQCLEDYVIIEWKALDMESHKHCGDVSPPDVTVRTSQELLVFFNSDIQHHLHRGFRIEYELLDKYTACPPRHLKCRNSKCVSRSVMCDGHDDCLDGTDEERCEFKTKKPSNCGKTQTPPARGNERIVGGQPAVPHSWPWQVSIQRTDVFPSGHFCGGALINNFWVATATHCLLGRGPEDIRVVLGIHQQFKKDGGEVTRFVTDFNVHPEFDDMLLKNDISLIKLNAPVDYNERIQPVCLPQKSEDLALGELLYATGWGETWVSGKSSYLKQTMIPVSNWTECATVHREVRPLERTMFCAGFDLGGHSTCFSDSGGPLVAENEDGLWTLYGITSWGPIQCASPGKPAVFTKISSFLPFLNSIYV